MSQQAEYLFCHHCDPVQLIHTKIESNKNVKPFLCLAFFLYNIPFFILTSLLIFCVSVAASFVCGSPEVKLGPTYSYLPEEAEHQIISSATIRRIEVCHMPRHRDGTHPLHFQVKCLSEL